ncbi:hypothetical protein PITCH_A680006 [uncultured Desulfobacterium sp.]|uniref:Uncharacterized protein n=1 Tax=uncultured Desulfobacterium sp. TaxID=201089 RepID=A0A445N1M6_9BACT|nr:hypothetical protein PITCH_A680006 [uncultured Desulfobacterium sp.]
MAAHVAEAASAVAEADEAVDNIDISRQSYKVKPFAIKIALWRENNDSLYF